MVANHSNDHVNKKRIIKILKKKKNLFGNNRVKPLYSNPLCYTANYSIRDR